MPTHWKQTVIVLPEEQLVEENEPIAFQLDMKRDTENPRRWNSYYVIIIDSNRQHTGLLVAATEKPLVTVTSCKRDF